MSGDLEDATRKITEILADEENDIDSAFESALEHLLNIGNQDALRSAFDVLRC